MLMADMTESERRTVRDLNKFWIPEGAELLELVDVLSVALLRMPDGSVRVTRLGDDGDDETRDPLRELEDLVAEVRWFLDIALSQIALSILARAPDVPPNAGDEMADLIEGIAQLDRGEGADLEEVVSKAKTILADAEDLRRAGPALPAASGSATRSLSALPAERPTKIS
jgi:hypothetical protein